jgi:hypothetical protein
MARRTLARWNYFGPSNPGIEEALNARNCEPDA